MAHTIADKQKLVARVRRIRGQVEGVERALTGDANCEQVLHLIAGVKGATAGLMSEIVEEHVRTHFVDADRQGALDSETAEQLLAIIRTYFR